MAAVAVDDGDEAGNWLALIWGELTDRVGLRPAEVEQAEAHMITAAREWLTVEGDQEAEARYFDRWLLNILGFEPRSAPPRPGPRSWKPMWQRCHRGFKSHRLRSTSCENGP
ncbi:hypothetical protein [Streptomyces sp. NPDC096152]|uniref:hypothetical protein n=1 Tax=Streptomyces sp. NPDC096152 TaxID=3366078 RepID=UPI00382E956C